jgi:hypothetical protein
LIIYRVRLDVPRALVLIVSRLLARDRKEVGTRKKRALPGFCRTALFGSADCG